jgi:hypothetical protein
VDQIILFELLVSPLGSWHLLLLGHHRHLHNVILRLYEHLLLHVDFLDAQTQNLLLLLAWGRTILKFARALVYYGPALRRRHCWQIRYSNPLVHSFCKDLGRIRNVLGEQYFCEIGWSHIQIPALASLIKQGGLDQPLFLERTVEVHGLVQAAALIIVVCELEKLRFTLSAAAQVEIKMFELLLQLLSFGEGQIAAISVVHFHDGVGWPEPPLKLKVELICLRTRLQR